MSPLGTYSKSLKLKVVWEPLELAVSLRIEGNLVKDGDLNLFSLANMTVCVCVCVCVCV